MDWNAMEAAISAECLSEWLHRLFLEYDNNYIESNAYFALKYFMIE